MSKKGEKAEYIINGKQCIFEYGEFGWDVEEYAIQYFKKWVTCIKCGYDVFELCHGEGQHQLISRCKQCAYTQTEYDG